jgi:inorganic triphosphatase YgiF
MELELRSPEHPHRVVTLHRLALELQGIAPIMLGAESKADRGYRLVIRTTPDAVKSANIAFDDTVTVRAGIRAILRSCSTHIAANQAAALAETDMGGVHQMRVGARRLRSAMRLFRDFIASPEATGIARRGEPPAARSWQTGARAKEGSRSRLAPLPQA